MLRKSVSRVCPACGSAEYWAAPAGKGFTLVDDRLCASCNMLYTPPTPFAMAVATLVMSILLLLMGGICAVMVLVFVFGRSFVLGLNFVLSLIIGSVAVCVMWLSVASARRAVGSLLEVQGGSGSAFPVVPLPTKHVRPPRDGPTPSDPAGDRGHATGRKSSSSQ